MAQDMRGRSWRSLAAARLAPIKDYLAQRDLRPPRSDSLSAENVYPDDAPKRPSWSQRWTGRSNSDADDVVTTERVVLLPGWASKRYRPPPNRAGAYDIEIFVSGYVVKDKAADVLSRSQRTLLRLAKSFASLPKLPDQDDSEDSLPSRSTENLLDGIELPPRPDEMTPELEKRALTRPRQFSSLGTDSTPTPSRPSSPSLHSTPDLSSARPLKTPSNGANGVDIMRWHANLEARLRPFWSGVLSNRTLRLSVRPHFEAGPMFPSPSELALLEEPLTENSTITDANGAFKMRLVVPWNALQPRGAPKSSVHTDYEHAWAVTAELMPSPPSRPPTPYESYPSGTPLTFTPTAITTERVTLTHSPIRVISDIDDTVKLSGVNRGARAVFHNVFVKDLAENVIPGMGEWYSEMWRRGVRFHYVSNGPFELLPVINDFFQLAQLPAGSVRLRSYGTRSLFSGLLSAPAERKRDGVVEVLKSFPASRFILIGDSGEQDLELYASVAQEFPGQILCIFIRDVNTYEDGGYGIDDPTGVCVLDGRISAQDLQAKRKGSSGVPASRGGRRSPQSRNSQSLPSPPTVSRASSGSTDGGVPTLMYGTGPPELHMDPLSSEPGSGDMSQSLAPCMLMDRTPSSEPDKQRSNLQIRLWKARMEAPPNVVIRVFREPEECVEAFHTIEYNT